MDLMRTLLIYMSATLTLAVQSTAAPKETPAPTPVPTAVVETAETPAPDGETMTAVPPEEPDEAKTAKPTDKNTPLPVPLITPNQRGYHNLAMGAKGKDVRKLQEKLIELRYLPEGAADGAYGRQTYNAVKKFQYYNGLTADGIAGRKTQTNLFENPDIAANPEVPATEPTTAPETDVPMTEVPETKAPATETPTEEPGPTEEPTEEPKATEVPTEEPEPTEKPTEEPKATEAPTEEPEATEKPTEEPTDIPAVTEKPVETVAPGNEIIENLDLDADVYEPITAMVALNEGNGPLEFVATKDGVPVTARPRLSQNGARIRVSLDDLCECIEGWRLTDDGVGSVVLEAGGYTLVLYNEDKGCSATLDSAEIPMKDDDFDFETEGHFINAEFLAGALKGEAVWDQEENTLMLRISGRNAGETTD